MAKRLEEAGANGLVLFNRYLEPDINTESMTIEPKIVLSDRRELYLPLRWIAILKGQLSVSLGATSGIHTGDDIVKALLAGADVAMLASVLLQRGPEHVCTLVNELRDWMHEREYSSVEQLKGSMSHANCPNPSALERANYTHALVSFSDKVSANES
jgi:dihydroorotate dehydrogenase (fumarate)